MLELGVLVVEVGFHPQGKYPYQIRNKYEACFIDCAICKDYTENASAV